MVLTPFCLHAAACSITALVTRRVRMDLVKHVETLLRSELKDPVTQGTSEGGPRHLDTKVLREDFRDSSPTDSFNVTNKGYCYFCCYLEAEKMYLFIHMESLMHFNARH